MYLALHPSCKGRNPEFLTGSWQYTLALFTAAARINMLSQWLRPIIAPILTASTRSHFSACLKAAEPVIKSRMAEAQVQKPSALSNTHVCPSLYRVTVLCGHFADKIPCRMTPYSGS